MKKTILLATGLLLLAGTSTACSSMQVSKDGNNLEIGKSTSKSKNSKKTSTAKSDNKQSAKQAATTLDDAKAKKLDDTMQNRSKAKKYNYAKYDGKHALKVSGGRLYPDTFKKDKFTLDGKKISIGWAPEGGDTFAYKVMAIYNHDFDQHGNHETFLFCLHDKKPIVLVDRTKTGNTINLARSTDQSLNKQFAGIMNGSRY